MKGERYIAVEYSLNKAGVVLAPVLPEPLKVLFREPDGMVSLQHFPSSKKEAKEILEKRNGVLRNMGKRKTVELDIKEITS